MTKKEQRVLDEYVRYYNIDTRTLPMIVHHYIDIGERTVAQLTKEVIDEQFGKDVERDKKIAREGKISLITPEFTRYLLTACAGLYQIDPRVRYKIIKEYLV